MSLDRVVGVIDHKRGESNVQWKIYKFPWNSAKEDRYLESPPFYFWNRRWCLRFYPNGESQSAGWLAIYLVSMNATKPENLLMLLVGFRLTLRQIESKLKLERSEETHTFYEDTQSCGWREIYRGNLIKSISNQIDITISCSVKQKAFPSVATQTMCCSSKFIKDFQNLLLKGPRSDVTFEVQEEKIKAHRLILGARSVVFAAMFEQNTREETDSIIKINDCDPDAFKSFLEFMYTAKVKNLSPKNVNSVYMMADKYSVANLKVTCAEFIKDMISEVTVCDTLALAVCHNDAQLKESAKKFLKNNFKIILPTKQWKSFAVKNPEIAVEMMES